jgi:hypothetical protein
VEIRCTHCGQTCWVPNTSGGAEVVCPVCEKTFVADGAASAPADNAEFGSDLLGRELPVVFGPVLLKPRSHAEPPARRRVRRRPALRRSILIAAGGLSLVAVIVTCFTLLARTWSERPAVGATSKLIPLTEWQADPALTSQLGAAKNVDAFQLDLPKGYLLFGVMREPGWLPLDAKFMGLEFEGHLGNEAQLCCMMVTFAGRSELKGDLNAALERYFEWMQHHAAFTSLSHDPGVIGLLNKRYVIRSSFSGKLRLHGKMTTVHREGDVLVMIDKDRQICLYTFCSPEGRRLRPLLEAAMLTWRLR